MSKQDVPRKSFSNGRGNNELAQALRTCRAGFASVGLFTAVINLLMLAPSTARLEATHKSVPGGERINLDVLNAQQHLFSARRDLAQSRYDYLRTWVQIRFVAGVLSADDLHSLERYFIVQG